MNEDPPFFLKHYETPNKITNISASVELLGDGEREGRQRGTRYKVQEIVAR